MGAPLDSLDDRHDPGPLPTPFWFRMGFAGAVVLALGVTAAHPALLDGLGDLSPAGKTTVDALLCLSFGLLGAALVRARERGRAPEPRVNDEAVWF